MDTIRHLFRLWAVASVIFTGVTLTAKAQDSLTTGLVAYYPLNGNANDETLSSLNLISQDITYDTDRFGVAKGAARFNGVSSILLQPQNILDLSKDYTVSFWVSLDDVRLTYQGLFNSIPHNGMYIVYNHPPSNNRIRFQIGAGNYWISEDSGGENTNYISNQWYFMSFRKNGNIEELFINSVLDSSNSVPVNLNALNVGWHLGGDGDTITTSGQPLKGLIDDVRIYNRSLTLSEITSLNAFGPQTTLTKAVIPKFSNLVFGTKYQLQVSNNTMIWTNQGTPFVANGNTMTYPQYWDVNNWSELYFRLQVSP